MANPVILQPDCNALLDQAKEEHQKGDFAEAKAGYQEILLHFPTDSDALSLLGLLCHQQGDQSQAIGYIEKALQLAPDKAAAWVNLAEVYRTIGDLEKGEQAARKAIALQSDMAEGHNNLGVILKEQGLLEEAEQCFNEALRYQPNSINGLNNMGSLCHSRTEYEQALEWYALALGQDHGNQLTHHNLGNTLMELGRLEEAKSALHKALHGKNNKAETFAILGNLYCQKREFARAAAVLERAREIQPENISHALNLAFIHLDMGWPYLGIELLEQVLSDAPDSLILLNALVHLYSQTDDIGQAYTLIERILHLSPNHCEALCARAHLCLVEGKARQAEVLCRQVLARDKEYATGHYILSYLLAADKCEAEAESIEEVLAKKSQPLAARVQLFFALGRVLEKTGHYDRAFGAFAEGNRLKRTTFQYGLAQDDQISESLIRTYTPDFIKARNNKGCCSRVPVFIVGMTRSGTTLIEQIISSHNKIFGAGEIRLLTTVMADFAGVSNVTELSFDKNFLRPERVAELGETYAGELQKLSPDSQRITNKMPGNFLNIGMIKLILPNAVIIHCQRNPLDTCLSIFKTLFTTGHEYAYDFEEIAGYYLMYEKVMAHWHACFPGSILDVHLDDLIDNQEKVTRKLVSHCGLEWDPACLFFQENRRHVHTASLVRVREPLKSSSGLWKHYGDKLELLLSAFSARDG